MESYLAMFFDVIFGLFALFILTKFLGKTQITQLTPFDFISAVILGELVGNALFDEKAGIPEIAFVVILWGILLYSTEFITRKFKSTRKFIEGEPDIVIYKGKLIRDTMKENKLDINQLQDLLRVKDVFSISEVEYAILERNGTVSVMKKSDFQTPTRSDMKIAPQEVNLTSTLINDGEIIYDNLKENNLTKEWLIEQLEQQDFQHVEDVFYAEYIKDKKLYILPYENRDHKRWNI